MEYWDIGENKGTAEYSPRLYLTQHFNIPSFHYSNIPATMGGPTGLAF
jgi:hypothetical protein